jgi:hypothetical protein
MSSPHPRPRMMYVWKGYPPPPNGWRYELDNPQLTEAGIIHALMRADAPAPLVKSVCAHTKWSLRRDIRIALLGNENTPFARVLEFAHSLPIRQLREILRSGRLPARTRKYLLKEIDLRDADS